jgi:hypothetical protein
LQGRWSWNSRRGNEKEKGRSQWEEIKTVFWPFFSQASHDDYPCNSSIHQVYSRTHKIQAWRWKQYPPSKCW